MRPSRAVAAWLIATSLGAGPLAWSAPDTREARAKTACASGRPDQGVELLAELFTETGDLNYVYNQGRCYQQNGVADKAINRFREYLRRSSDLADKDRREVEQFIAELEQQVERRAAADAAARAAADQRSSAEPARLKKIGVGAGVAGAVGIGAGVILSFQVRSRTRDVQDKLARAEKVSNQELGVWMREGGRLETFQWLAYGVGAAAIAGGITCYLLGYQREREQTVAWTMAPVPVQRGLAGVLTVRY